MPLSDAKIRALPPTDKNLKLFDGGGLYLAVSPAGGKTWRLKYRFGGKEQTLTIGRYPQIGLKEAREKAQKAKASLEQGIDPGQMKKAVAAAQTGGGDSFEAIAREWFERNKSKWTPKHGERVLLRLEQNMFPYIGKIHIGILTAPQILLSLRKIEERGAIETAHRVLQECRLRMPVRRGHRTGRARRHGRPQRRVGPGHIKKHARHRHPLRSRGAPPLSGRLYGFRSRQSRPSSCPSRICAARRTQASGMDGV